MEELDRIPISSIKQYNYCKRRFALMFVDIQWGENHKIVEGDLLHEKVDNPFIKESRGDIVRSRSVPVYSDVLNIQGICDLLEFCKAESGIHLKGKKGLWRINPIEYKNGKPEKSDADNCQLCAVAMCLEEMFGVAIESGDVYYGKIKHRVTIQFNNTLRERVTSSIFAIKQLLLEKKIPKRPDGQNCSLCSLDVLCIPKLFDREDSTKNRLKCSMKGLVL